MGVGAPRGVKRGGIKSVQAIKRLPQRRLHDTFLRYHDPENWSVVREALRDMDRADLIDPRPDQLVPFTHLPRRGMGTGAGKGSG